MAAAIAGSDGTPADAAARFERLIGEHPGPFELPELDPYTLSVLDAQAVADTLHMRGCPLTVEELCEFEIAALHRALGLAYQARTDLLHPLIRRVLFQRRTTAYLGAVPARGSTDSSP